MNDIGETSGQYLKRAAKALIGDIPGHCKDLFLALLGLFGTILAIPALPFALVYFKHIEEHSNCLLWAVEQKIRTWRVVDIIRTKNSRGRSHWQIKVRQTGDVYEWYAKGASKRSHLQNLWYKGEIKLVKGRDK